MKKLLTKTLLTALILSLLSSISLSQGSVEDYVGTITGDDVRIRVSASTNADILGKFQSGDKVIVVETKGDWVSIKLPEFVPVWISKQYVEADKTSQIGTITGDNVNIRSDADTSKPVLGKLDKGNKVEIVGLRNDFFLIVPPAQATGWVSTQYVKKLGEVHKYLIALKEERNNYLKRAAAKNESENQPDIAKAYLNLVQKVDTPAIADDSKKEAYEKEKNKFDELMMKFTQSNFNADTANLESLKSFSFEIKAFADNCTSEIKTGAEQLLDNINLKIKNIEEQRKAKVEADKIAADLQKEEEQKKALIEKVKDKLLRVNNREYVAVGVVVDARDIMNETIYYIAEGNMPQFRLALSMSSKVNLRDFWHKTVGVKGKIIYDEDQQYPIVICTEMEVLAN